MRISDWSSDVCSSDLDDARSDHRCQQDWRVASLPAVTDDSGENGRGRLQRLHYVPALLPSRRSCAPGTAGRPAKAPARVRSTDSKSRSEEHTSELQSLMRISYAVFCLKHNNKKNIT